MCNRCKRCAGGFAGGVHGGCDSNASHMKTLATLTRHIITYVIGMLVAWLAIYLTGADLESATKAANALVEPLVILAGFVAVIVSRLAMPIFDKIFRRGAGEETDSDAGASGGKSSLALFLMATAAVLMGALPSCATNGDGEYPVTASLSWRDPNTGAKAGLTYTPKAKLKAAVTVPVYDAETGEKLGVTTIPVDLASGK
jgi:hypothetical protein